ncbi:MAG: ABC transporter substrate-binding protein [Deltaproteobacteria bacterium]|nr:ABC transporter substrate-binding protein [Deltaproteobacteria bacterium]
MSRGFRYFISFAVIFGMIVGAVACKKKIEAARSAEDPIRIGEFLSLTGATATFGISTRNGVELAVEEINAGGGVLGRKLKTIVLDDQGKPEEAATAVTKLINEDRVDVLIGEVASSLSLAAAPIAQAKGVPMISPSSTNPKVTAVGDHIFRICFIDPFQGAVMAQFASMTLKAKRAALLRDIRNDYSIGLADFFVEKFKKLGGEVAIDQSYSAGDVDFKAQLTAIKATKPDVIFVPGYYTEVGLVARQARELGITVPLLGGDGWASEKLTEIGGIAIAGSFFSDHCSMSDPNPVLQSFVKKYEAKFGSKPDALAALGYDSAMLVVDALKRADSLDKSAIRKALAETRDYQGITGLITMDAERNAVKSAVVMKVTADGNHEYVTTVQPN